MNFDTLGSVIQELAAEYVQRYGLDDVSAINRGFCSSFADDVITALGAAYVVLCSTPTELWFGSSYGEMGGHFWVKIEDLYYDAESPEGVADWRDLQFFVRERAEAPHFTVGRCVAKNSQPVWNRT